MLGYQTNFVKNLCERIIYKHFGLDNWIEIWMPADSSWGCSCDLSRTRNSIQRNPIIAEVFYLAGLIEQWGCDTNRVIAQCREAGIALQNFKRSRAPPSSLFACKWGSARKSPRSLRLLGNPIPVKSYNASLERSGGTFRRHTSSLC